MHILNQITTFFVRALRQSRQALLRPSRQAFSIILLDLNVNWVFERLSFSIFSESVFCLHARFDIGS